MMRVKHYQTTLGILTMIILLIVFVKIGTWGYIYNSEIKLFKDSIDLYLKVISTSLLIGASLFSYFKFFHGRVFSQRIEIGHQCQVLSLNDQFNLVEIVADIKNIGTLPIWAPWVQIELIKASVDDVDKPVMIPNTIDDHLIDTSEIIYRTFHQRVPKTNVYCTYRMTIGTGANYTWEKIFSVATLKLPKEE